MKRIIALVLALVLAFAVAAPCYAAEKKTAAKREENVVTIGQWPQSLVTSEKEIWTLNNKLRSENVQWQSNVLPDGRTVLYADISAAQSSPYDLSCQQLQPTHRAVRIGTGAIQWYRWEPLTWEWVSYNGLYMLVCTSVVFAVENNEDAVITWLRDSFYRDALSAAEQEEWRLCMLTHGMTNDSVAAVGDYAALYGADGSFYYQWEDPEIPEPSQLEEPVFETDPTAQKELSAGVAGKDSGAKSAAKAEKNTPVSTKQACKSPAFIGVRPALCWSSRPYAGGIISWLLHLLGL